MSYRLRAVIGQSLPLDEAAKIVAGTPVALTTEVSLIAWTDDLFDRLGPDDGSYRTGLPYLHSALVPILTQASELGPLAYVEAEFFGGIGEQGAAVFLDGRLDWSSPTGPIDLRLQQQSPISHALHLLGVSATTGNDEFDTIGLHRHRNIEDWV